jgi:hypothetical protein
MSKTEFNNVLRNKIGYDAENKKFLIRVYKPLYFVMESYSKPRWNIVMEIMLGSNPKKCNPSSYYSSVRRTLKDINVCYYDKTLGYFVKGSNWDRFFSNEDWSWFTMNTGSCEKSYINFK